MNSAYLAFCGTQSVAIVANNLVNHFVINRLVTTGSKGYAPFKMTEIWPLLTVGHINKHTREM